MISRIDDSVDQVDIKVTHDSLVRIRTVGLAPLLVEIALRRHHADHPGELPSWLVGNPELSEAQLVGLVKESEIDLDELGHRQDSAALLELLANRFRYPEAVLTLGKRYYADTCVSAVKFASFLQLHKENEWLLESLAREPFVAREIPVVYRGFEAVSRHPERSYPNSVVAQASNGSERGNDRSGDKKPVWHRRSGGSKGPRRKFAHPYRPAENDGVHARS